MQNLVPQFILKKYSSQKNHGENSGQFQAISLFADLSGFSAATHVFSQHGQEAIESMAEVMLDIFTPLVSLVHGQGGFITTFAGDAFTAIFPSAGDPFCYARALAAAQAIQQHMFDHAVQRTPYGDFHFAIKLGLGDGAVEWGILQSERPSPCPGAQNAAYFFSGPAIEAVAEAEHHAQSGELVMSQAVYNRVQAFIDALPVGESYWCCQNVLVALPAPLAASPEEPLAEAEAAFIPKIIRERENLGDFRQVVSVFIQLMGIETRQDLDIFMQAVFSLLDQFEGYLNRVDFGDKGCNLLLYWGMPISHENDIQRALDFVMELGNYTPGSFRAGLTYHPMYAGLSGSPERGEYTCYGAGVNLAARLMMAAPWGGLWVDDQIASRARKHYVFEYVDHLEFKGFPEKQAVHNLLERRPAGEIYFDGQMVGRQDELTELSAFVRPLLSPPDKPHYAGLLVVVGDAGLGKSRLVQEFATNPGWPVAGAVQVFLCQADQVLRQSLNPFRYWLQNYFDQSSSQSSERNKRAFSRKLDQLIAAQKDSELGQELNRTRSFLGALVGLEWESSLYARLAPQGRYENTLQALLVLLKAESLRQPVLLVLEDAHWLDEDSQEFIRRLDHAAEGYPLAVLATARPERMNSLLGANYPYRQLTLTCFSTEELALLARDRLAGPIAPAILELLTGRAESNPFFAEQILLYLREQGKLTCQDGIWNLVVTSGEMPLPTEVRNIFIARLDRLAKDVQEVVQAAAILGREFEVRVLARVLENDPRGKRPPDELSRQVLTAEQEAIWAAINQMLYLFRHALLRDAAYEMQLKAKRRELHRLAASALEYLHIADNTAGIGWKNEYSSQIAYHYEAACRLGLEEVRPQACKYLEEAAQQAAARFENAVSLDWFGRALALIPGDALEDRLRLLLAREAIYHRLGRRDEQRADLLALQEIVHVRQNPAEKAELALRQARLANVRGDFSQAEAQAQAAVAFSQTVGLVDMEASAQLEWGNLFVMQSDFSNALGHLRDGLRLADVAGRKDLQAAKLRQLGVIANSRSEYAEAISYHERVLEIYQEIGDRPGEAMAFLNLGDIAVDQGNSALALQNYKHSLAICQETGLRRGQGMALLNLSIIAIQDEDLVVARQYSEQALSILREIDDRVNVTTIIGNLGLIAMLLGDFTSARVYCQQSLDTSRELGDRQIEAIAHYNLACIADSTADSAAARQHYQQALSICQEIDFQLLKNPIWNNFAYHALAENDPSVAQRNFEQALEVARDVDLAHFAAESLAGLAYVALVQGNLDIARACTNEILTILETNPSLQGAENPQRALLNCARVLLALGDARGRILLDETYARLQEKAARFTDDELRRAFLENVPDHKAIVDEWRAAQPDC